MNLLSCVAVLLIAGCTVEAANILAVFPLPSPSHVVLGSALLKALAKRGHHVTMLSAYPLKEPVENYTDIFLDGLLEYKERSAKYLMNFNASHWNLMYTFDILMEGAEVQMQSKALDQLLKSNVTFDLCINLAFGSDVFLGLAHHYKAPVVFFSPVGPTELTNAMMGAPMEYSYVPGLFFGYPDEMNFLQRVANVLGGNLLQLVLQFVFIPAHDTVMHKRFPDAPPLKELLKNVDLILFNSHQSIESPRPYLPNMIQVGGLQMEDEELPPDLMKFLDEADDGAVFFSLGSNLKSSELPEDKLNGILNVFRRFTGRRFLWKFEADGIELPDNVKIGKWLPQRAVLAHPKVDLFITHAGLLSLTEAVYYGVPMIAMPGFGDQNANTVKVVTREYGLKLTIDDLNEENFYSAIHEVVNNPKYKENIAKSSDLMRNSLVKPMDTAIYWVEHVLKYKGAPHLRNAGLKLRWYQYYLLDVIAFLLAVLVVLALINFYTFRLIIRFLKRKLIGQQKVKTN